MQNDVKISLKGQNFRKWSNGPKTNDFEKEIDPKG